jgi:hypothetical protein
MRGEGARNGNPISRLDRPMLTIKGYWYNDTMGTLDALKSKLLISERNGIIELQPAVQKKKKKRTFPNN